jgi:xanthine/uracil permease
MLTRRKRPPETRVPKLLRSILAVLLGYGLFAVGAATIFVALRVDPHSDASASIILDSTLYGVVFAVLGGILAATIAGRRPMWHAAAVGAFILAGALISLLASRASEPRWSQLLAALVIAPSTLLGGLLRRFLDRARRSS